MLALLFAVLTPLACHSVNSDFIHGQDLAKAVPALASIPLDARIGAAPMPGQQRVFRVLELKRIAQQYKIAAEPSEDVCFEWETAVPDRQDLQAAMEKTLTGRNAAIQILESSNLGAPHGDVVFPLAGLTITTAQSATLWRGYIQYGETRRFPVWARVVVTVRETHLVAAKDLSAGAELDQNDFKAETYEGPLTREQFLSDGRQVEGKRLKFAVRAGSALLDRMLDSALEISRGELVNAVVENGAARLEVQAEAQEDGRMGQVITLRNPRSGRSFRGRVEAKGTVLVVPGGPFGLAVETKKS
ncbi:MAG TPA: flagellar basal body P-ring formation chaperone FlgA [Bryobacteraceae bacterium]|jgi:flagella basal body P-ring formation protein FlgA|nr:flagellar basal body P-ring formation chaperone FlgA [Bryobacteraceae bacterium]